mmetsp:Transcript_10863/g.33028  ORF Transcript_10863/g.33028 Transcript_10863/m.33028 type:complete len:247 (-) Transcript_10863:88-828(-)
MALRKRKSALHDGESAAGATSASGRPRQETSLVSASFCDDVGVSGSTMSLLRSERSPLSATLGHASSQPVRWPRREACDLPAPSRAASAAWAQAAALKFGFGCGVLCVSGLMPSAAMPSATSFNVKSLRFWRSTQSRMRSTTGVDTTSITSANQKPQRCHPVVAPLPSITGSGHSSAKSTTKLRTWLGASARPPKVDAERHRSARALRAGSGTELSTSALEAPVSTKSLRAEATGSGKWRQQRIAA